MKREAEGGRGYRGRSNDGRNPKRRGPGHWQGHETPPSKDKLDDDAALANNIFSKIVVRYIGGRPQAMRSLDAVMTVVHDMVSFQRSGNFSREVAKATVRNLPGCRDMSDRDLDPMMREISGHFQNN